MRMSMMRVRMECAPVTFRTLARRAVLAETQRGTQRAADVMQRGHTARWPDEQCSLKPNGGTQWSAEVMKRKAMRCVNGVEE